jgi:hypothetical protein
MTAKVIDVIDNEPLNLRTTVYCNEHVQHEELPWLEFEIPCPPSKNQKIGKLGNHTPTVRRWAHQAGLALIVSRVNRCKIIGRFEAEFLFGRNKRADFHNYEEFLFDWLQSEFIENDKLCEWRSSGWSDAVPKGRVVVRLRPWMKETG